VRSLLRDGEVQLASIVARSTHHRFHVDALLDKRVGVDGAPFTDDVPRRVVDELTRWMEYVGAQERVGQVLGDDLADVKRGRDDDYSSPVIAATHLWNHANRRAVFAATLAAYRDCGMQPFLWSSGLTAKSLQRVASAGGSRRLKTGAAARAAGLDLAASTSEHKRDAACTCPLCAIANQMATQMLVEAQPFIRDSGAIADVAAFGTPATPAAAAGAEPAGRKAGSIGGSEGGTSVLTFTVKPRAVPPPAAASTPAGKRGTAATTPTLPTAAGDPTGDAFVVHGFWPTLRVVARLWLARLWLSHLYTSWMFRWVAKRGAGCSTIGGGGRDSHSPLPPGCAQFRPPPAALPARGGARRRAV
jgi:hypothetical protein